MGPTLVSFLYFINELDAWSKRRCWLLKFTFDTTTPSTTIHEQHRGHRHSGGLKFGVLLCRVLLVLSAICISTVLLPAWSGPFVLLISPLSWSPLEAVLFFLSSMYFSALVPCFRGLILRRVDFVFRPPQQNNTVYFQRRQELGSRDLPSTKLLRLLLPRSHHRMPPPHHLEAWYVVRVSVMVYDAGFIHGIWWGFYSWYIWCGFHSWYVKRFFIHNK